VGEWLRRLQENLAVLRPARSSEEPKLPSVLDVVATSINIMQVRISRSRMAGEPPDVIVAPRLGHLGLLDFHRAREAIDEGRRAADAVLHSVRALSNTQ
jgi:NTE family protein